MAEERPSPASVTNSPASAAVRMASGVRPISGIDAMNATNGLSVATCAASNS